MKVFSTLLIAFSFLLSAISATAQTSAPVGPGQDAQWLSAGKQAIGTSANLESKIWFTLANGVLTEVLYPNVQTANVQMLQFVVVNQRTKKVQTEWDDAFHQIKSLRSDALSFQQINTAKSGEWKITKSYVTDPKTDSLLIDVRFDRADPNLALYVYYDPSIGNSGMGDRGIQFAVSTINLNGLEASDEKAKIRSLLTFSVPISEMKSAFAVGNVAEIFLDGVVRPNQSNAGPGNIVQTARITKPDRFLATLSFDRRLGGVPDVVTNPAASRDFETVRRNYDQGWADFVKSLPQVDLKYQSQFNMAAMVMKSLEDKTTRGANVASLSVPWGGGGNANDGGNGYRMVWSRDLYHVFTAFLAIGDRAAAERALDFLFKIQQKEDGSFPQNSDLTGKMGWGSLQMDEVGYPLIMAWQIGKFDKETYEKHVKRAADFIVKNGPFSPQERWEERPGYSPSTIAAEIAGLVCAADIAKRNGDEASSVIWLAAADDWARNIERWTATTKGKYGDGNYYLRISEKGEPDGNHKIELNNNAGTFYEHEIVDAGFLELVRLGIKPADDPLVVKSLKVIDQLIKIETPNGPAFYRYNHDGYGEMDDGRKWNWDGKYTGKGRPWPLLSGERAQYEIALCERENEKFRKSPAGQQNPTRAIACNIHAALRLDHMAKFASESLMITEQIWDKKDAPPNTDRRFIPELKFGEGTGSATPLAWSMAQFIRLATNLKAGQNLDTPQIVYDRYKNGIPAKVTNFGGLDEETIIPVRPGVLFLAERQSIPGTRVAFSIEGKTQIITAGGDGKAKLGFTMPTGAAVAVAGVHAPDGATSFERVKILGAPPAQEFSPDLIEKVKAAKTSPIVDGEGAVFFYRGKAESVQIAGDMTGWSAGRIFLQPIADNLFAYRMKLRADARAEYKMIVNGKWELDSLNADRLDNGVGGQNSFFAMPAYKPINITSAFNNLDEFEIVTKSFGTRKIKVYLPSTYANSTERVGAIYIQDGSEYASRAKAPGVFEDLLRAQKVRPFIFVFIDPKDRMTEYRANDAWADFVANEVVPEVDKRYRTISDRNGRAVLGASLGGITSLHIGLRHPDKFSRIGAQSSSSWVDNERVVKALEKLDTSKTSYRFYLDDGIFEGADDTQRVNVMLRGKGYTVRYLEGATGHNWTAWRDRLADAMITLLN